MMFKKLLAITFLALTPAVADEIKVNMPFAAHHFGDRHDGGKWNEYFLDDGAIGISYIADNGLGASVNTSINSYGKNRSIYVTADYMPEIWSNGDLFAVNAGGHIGFATNYKELSGSGMIPFVGASIEGEVGNFSLMATLTPSYKDAPSAVIFMARFSVYGWE